MRKPSSFNPLRGRHAMGRGTGRKVVVPKLPKKVVVTTQKAVTRGE
jgi:hypothetical protein